MKGGNKIKMEEQIKIPDLMKIGIGTKELASLKPLSVKIIGLRIDEVGAKQTKKLVCICKHPDREDNVEISSIKYVKQNQIRNSGLWVHVDEDNKIPKGSALATFMGFENVENIESLEGKDVATTLDDAGYLCFKAY